MFRKYAISMVAAAMFLSAAAMQTRAQVVKNGIFSPEFQGEAMESVVRIRASDGEKMWQGSGVAVMYSPENGNTIILTAAHVVKGAKRIDFEVFTKDSLPNAKRRYESPTARWWINDNHDIALIVANMWVPRTSKLADDASDVKKGDLVLSLGCGIGFPPVADIGRVSGTRNDDYVVDRGGVGGRSGGPLFNTKGVIGIVSEGRDDQTVFVSLPKILSFVKSVATKIQASK